MITFKTPLALSLVMLLILTIVISCKNKESKLYIKNSVVRTIDGKQTRTDSIKTISSEYFEVQLASANNGSLFVARKDIRRPQIGEEYHAEFFSIVDDKGKEIEFKTSSDFLNFLDNAGYEMKEQQKVKYGIDYTFKKKD